MEKSDYTFHHKTPTMASTRALLEDALARFSAFLEDGRNAEAVGTLPEGFAAHFLGAGAGAGEEHPVYRACGSYVMQAGGKVRHVTARSVLSKAREERLSPACFALILLAHFATLAPPPPPPATAAAFEAVAAACLVDGEEPVFHYLREYRGTISVVARCRLVCGLPDPGEARAAEEAAAQARADAADAAEERRRDAEEAAQRKKQRKEEQAAFVDGNLYQPRARNVDAQLRKLAEERDKTRWDTADLLFEGVSADQMCAECHRVPKDEGGELCAMCMPRPEEEDEGEDGEDGEEDEEDKEEEEIEELACTACGGGDGEGKREIVMCNFCDATLHIACIEASPLPARGYMQDGMWTCGPCFLREGTAGCRVCAPSEPLPRRAAPADPADPADDEPTVLCKFCRTLFHRACVGCPLDTDAYRCGGCTKKFKFSCACGAPERDAALPACCCAECKRWFHPACLHLEGIVSREWLCSDCS